MSAPEDILDALEKQSVQSRLLELEKQFTTQKAVLDGLKDERDRALRWGIIALGTAVMGMGTWIVNLFAAGHIK